MSISKNYLYYQGLNKYNSYKIGDIVNHETLGEVMIFSFENEISTKVIVLNTVTYYLNEKTVDLKIVRNLNAKKIESPNWNKWYRIITENMNDIKEFKIYNRLKDLEIIVYNNFCKYEINIEKNERKLEKNRNFLMKVVHIFKRIS